MASSTTISKATKMALGGHTAGIYADMSVDGPAIGTLVAIIDRAKNLPNRKTMGKQNPYCAARLGKEAKKTETDMRGGQTPRWDQELRFTVHESPDYYQLKVSVFNDDKKTELIGETWIDLKNVIIQGGGQNDVWHGLQYKGKYSGDIRIELTYYDTRPKSEAVVERRKEVEKAEVKSNPTPHTLSGPRQPKPVKRRPLPADPTGATPPRPAAPEHAQSAPSREHSHPPPSRPTVSDNRPSSMGPGPSDPPMRPVAHEHPHQTPPSQGQRHYESPNDVGRPRASTNSRHPMGNAPPRQHYPRDSRGFSEEPVDMYDPRSQQMMAPVDSGRYSQPPPDFAQGQQPGDYRHPQDPRDGYAPPIEHNTPYSANPYETPPRQSMHNVTTPENQRNSGYPPQSRGSRNSPYTTPNGYGSPQDIPQPRSAPGSGDRSSHYNRYSSSPTKNDVFRDSPLRNSVSRADFQAPYGSMPPQFEDDPGPPPPPPAHRDGLGQPSHQVVYNRSQPIPMPDPMNQPPARAPGNSPGQQPQAYIAYHADARSVSPSTERDPSYPSYSASSQTSYSQPRRYPSQDFGDNFNEGPVPPSLVAGYDPAIADAESERMMYENKVDRRRSYVALPASTSPQPLQPRGPPAYQMAIENTKPPPAPTVEDAEPQETSLALTKRRSVSPDIRSVPARKSVSPRPSVSPKPAGSEERSLSGIPFSPDSYDALNPNVGSSSSVQPLGDPYETPEQALEAARQREVEKLRDIGPIIGNDGRVIDPTDHLPTDTWAPEPERKSRKPEVVIRFKNAPASSKPRESETQRPQSMITSSRHSIGPQMTTDSGSPAAPAGRNRLQKQPGRRNSYIPPHVSDAAITPPRANNALRERENYAAYDNNSNRHSTSPYYSPQQNQRPPTSSSHSPSAGSYYHSPNSGPPIPAKVPIHPGNQNYPGPYSGGGADALSEEMKRIDIGTIGSGPGFGGGRLMRRPM
ncbi:hypothetical protein FQN54_002627 [Arachnomyces sp. PD_36]|nr:hypothetical protein FQN54_002627 [Arachnomyces sp. PD_36]